MAEGKEGKGLNVFTPAPGDKGALKAIDHYLMSDAEKLKAGNESRKNNRAFPKSGGKKKKDESIKADE